MQKSPLALVKERFGDKAGLVKAIEGLTKDELFLDRVNTDKGLDSVSNRKLLHLHDVLSQVKEQFGTREKLIEATAGQLKRDKDPDYRKSLEAYPTPRLYQIYRAAQKQSKKRA
ncbi:MAG: hypothetical protein OXU20_05935 [Myxococcales bacterium]|nr:hypothetical protein [Myxococcales bacterium]MDD9970205.1 hypothetical protein [Myxococcales bacterium]